MAGKAKEKAVEVTQVASVAEDTVVETTTVEQESTKPEKVVSEKTTLTPKALDPNQLVSVFNGFQGKLVYKSKKTGELFTWDGFGDEQEIELTELKSAKSSNKKFFINNWFLFHDPEIIDYLGVGQYYRQALTLEGFEDFFSLNHEQMEEKVSGLSEGQKRSLAYKTKQMVADGQLDSLKSITALERVLGVELVEH